MKATHVQVFSLLTVGIAVFATVVVFGVYQKDSTQSAEASHQLGDTCADTSDYRKAKAILDDRSKGEAVKFESIGDMLECISANTVIINPVHQP